MRLNLGAVDWEAATGDLIARGPGAGANAGWRAA
jgi:hypothetical protein